MRSRDELSRCSARLLVGDVVAGDGRGGRQPGKVDGGRGQRCELQVGGSLDNWFHWRGDFRTLDPLPSETGSKHGGELRWNQYAFVKKILFIKKTKSPSLMRGEAK